MEKELINAFLMLVFEGPVPMAEKAVRKKLLKIADEEHINNIIVEFSQMIEEDSLKKDVEEAMKQCCGGLWKIVESGTLDVPEQIRVVVGGWLNSLDIDKVYQDRLCDAFLEMMFWYIKEKNTLLYNDLCLQRECQRIFLYVKAVEERLKAIILGGCSEQQLKKRKLKEYLDNGWQAMVHIDNAERMQDRSEDRQRIEQAYRQGQQVVFLYGDPGIGKTVLAKKYANMGDYSKVFFLSYELSFEYTLKKLLSDEIEGNIDDIIDYFREIPAEEKQSVLMIIDNFNDDTYDADTEKYDAELKGPIYERLLSTGIRLLITTRIEVNGNQQEVKPLRNIRELFLDCAGEHDNSNDQRIDALIKAVRKNTLLVTLLAHIWKDTTRIEKTNLLEQLKKGEMARDEHEIAIETGRTYPAGTATFYRQLEEIFSYGPVLKSEGRKKWMASAALLPLEGMDKEEFLDIMQGEDKKEFKDLLNRRWISQDDKKIYVHAGIREVTRRNRQVTSYERCRQFCCGIGRKMDIDREESLHKRIRYRAFGQEIYNQFPKEKDQELLWLYYNLSDIYDHLKEKEMANQLAQAVLDQIELFQSNAIKYARILSGTAYSKIQSARSEEELEKPKEMLEQAGEILSQVPSSDRDAQYSKIRGKVYSNLGAHKQKIADIRKISARSAYEESEEMHKKTLEYRTDMVDQWEMKVTPHEFHELLKDKALSYKNVATEQFHLEKYEEAIKNHRQALRIYRRLGEESSCAFIHKLLTGCMLAWYRKDLELRDELMGEVLDGYPHMLQIFRDNGQIKYLDESLSSLDMIFKITKRDKKAEKYQEKVKEINRKLRSIIGTDTADRR